MQEIENNALFWQKVDTLVLSSTMKIDRPKGTPHRKYPNMIYPVDYGYLADTTSSDGTTVNVFRGTKSTNRVEAILISADILKKDCLARLLIGCTEEEKKEILEFMNQLEFQKTILVQRGNDVPEWATNDGAVKNRRVLRN